jgi:hypothetical protein
MEQTQSPSRFSSRPRCGARFPHVGEKIIDVLRGLVKPG